jgi:hypothetical protein
LLDDGDPNVLLNAGADTPADVQDKPNPMWELVVRQGNDESCSVGKTPVPNLDVLNRTAAYRSLILAKDNAYSKGLHIAKDEDE